MPSQGTAGEILTRRFGPAGSPCASQNPPAMSGRRRVIPPPLDRPLLWWALLLFSVANVALASSQPPLEGTPEWGRLGELWNVLTDHSSGAVYSSERFQELAPGLDRADADLTGLIGQKRLPAEAGEALRGLFHARYRYISEYCYLARPRSERTGYDAAQSASRWVVELQLSLLRDQLRAPTPDAKSVRGAEANLAAELMFLRECTSLSDSLTRSRKALTAKEEQHEKVDWQAFERERLRRETSLLELYRTRRLRPDRAMRRLAPYLVSLIRLGQASR